MSDAAAPWSDLVTAERIIALHGEILAAHPGMEAGADRNCIDGSLGGAWTADLYVTTEDENAKPGLVFAGYLLYYLAKNHCFGDGNKRTAFASMHEILAELGLTVQAEEDELVEFVLSIADGRIQKREDVVRWIADHLTELS